MEMKYIYICTNCGSAFSDLADKENQCDSCHKKLIETKISKADWSQYTSEQKKEVKAQVIDYVKGGGIKPQNTFNSNESGIISNSSIVATGSENLMLKELLSLTKVMQHDIHFMYVVLLIYLILTGLGIVIILANIL